MMKLQSGSIWCAVAIGLILAGCSGNHFGPKSSIFGSFSKGTSPAVQADDSGTSEPVSAASFESAKSGSMAMARLAERRGQTEVAGQLYRTIAENEPDNPAPHHRLGVMASRAGRFEEAEKSFAKALDPNPANPKVLCDLGYCYYLQQRLEESEAVLTKALRAEPNDTAVLNNLALVYGEQQRYDECLATFRRTCDEPEAYANLAFVYAQHGELDKSKAAYNQALTLDRQLRPAAEALAQLAQSEQLAQDFAATTDPSGPGADCDLAASPSLQPAGAFSPAPREPRVDRATFHVEPSGADAAFTGNVLPAATSSR